MATVNIDWLSKTKLTAAQRELLEMQRIGFMHSHYVKSDPISKVIRYIPPSSRTSEFVNSLLILQNFTTAQIRHSLEYENVG